MLMTGTLFLWLGMPALESWPGLGSQPGVCVCVCVQMQVQTWLGCAPRARRSSSRESTQVSVSFGSL